MHIKVSCAGCQVTSRPHDRFLRYSKWTYTFRTDLLLRRAGITGKTGEQEIQIITIKYIEKHPVERHKMKDQNSDASKRKNVK